MADDLLPDQLAPGQHLKDMGGGWVILSADLVLALAGPPRKLTAGEQAHLDKFLPGVAPVIPSRELPRVTDRDARPTRSTRPRR